MRLFAMCALLGSALFLPAKVMAQAKFPEQMRGSWCDAQNDMVDMEVGENYYDEGDGRCEVKKISRGKGHKVSVYRVDFLCESGVDGEKPYPFTERYTVFQIGKVNYTLRETSPNTPRSETFLHKKCNPG